MSDQKPDDRTLAQREDDATDTWTQLRDDVAAADHRREDLTKDLDRVESHVAELDDKAFEITVQQSGALDLINSPLGQDGDAQFGIMEIVDARTDALHGEVVDAAEDLSTVRADVADLLHDIEGLEDRVDILDGDVHDLRADGGHIHPEPTEAEIEEQEWTEDRMEEAVHAE